MRYGLKCVYKWHISLTLQAGFIELNYTQVLNPNFNISNGNVKFVSFGISNIRTCNLIDSLNSITSRTIELMNLKKQQQDSNQSLSSKKSQVSNV
jgi:hypothetical protein